MTWHLGRKGETCCSVCARHGGLGCSQPALRSIRSCDALRALAPYKEYAAATGGVKHCFNGNSWTHPSGHQTHNARGNAVWWNDEADPNQALCDHGPAAAAAGRTPTTWHGGEAQRFCPCGRYPDSTGSGHLGGPYCPRPEPDPGPTTTCSPDSAASPDRPPAKFEFTVTLDPKVGRWCPSPDPAGVWVDVFIPASELFDLQAHWQCDFITIVSLGGPESWHVIPLRSRRCAKHGGGGGGHVDFVCVCASARAGTSCPSKQAGARAHVVDRANNPCGVVSPLSGTTSGTTD